jgi:hypothetical protein
LYRFRRFTIGSCVGLAWGGLCPDIASAQQVDCKGTTTVQRNFVIIEYGSIPLWLTGLSAGRRLPAIASLQFYDRKGLLPHAARGPSNCWEFTATSIAVS